MRSTNKIVNVPDRHEHDNKEISIHGYPEYSSRAGYYHQYLEQKNINHDIFSRINEANRKSRAELVDNRISDVNGHDNKMSGPGSENDEFLEYAITDDEENRFYSSEGDGYYCAGEGNV